MVNETEDINEPVVTFEKVNDNLIKVITQRGDNNKAEVIMYVITSEDVVYLNSLKERMMHKYAFAY